MRVTGRENQSREPIKSHQKYKTDLTYSQAPRIEESIVEKYFASIHKHRSEPSPARKRVEDGTIYETHHIDYTQNEANEIKCRVDFCIGSHFDYNYNQNENV